LEATWENGYPGSYEVELRSFWCDLSFVF